MKLVGGARESTQCPLHARRVVLPLAPVDLVHQQRRVTDGGYPRPRRSTSVVCFVFGECRNCDSEGSGKASIAVVTIASIRSHRLVVRTEVCASG